MFQLLNKALSLVVTQLKFARHIQTNTGGHLTAATAAAAAAVKIITHAI